MEEARENEESGWPAPGDTGDRATDGAADETKQLLESGPRSGNRAGAMAFFALAVIVLAGLRFYLADTGPDAYIQRLDAALLTHAELSLAAMDEGDRMAVVPNWPLGLYGVLRRDIVVYAFLAAAAAWCWGLAARARGRRDAYLVHQKLSAELSALRERLDRLEGSGNHHGATDDREG